MNAVSKLGSVAVIAVALSPIVAPAHATTLTFDGACGASSCGSTAVISQDYGDVAGLLDVQYTRAYGSLALGAPGSEMILWRDHYNDLVNVAYGSAGYGSEIFFRSLDGGSVTLDSFDLGAWSDSVGTRQTQVAILDGRGSLLFTTGPILIGLPGNHASHFEFHLTSESGIGILFGPDAYTVGIDNIDFTVNSPSPVPVPAALPLLATGLGAMGLIARRRRVLSGALALSPRRDSQAIA